MKPTRFPSPATPPTSLSYARRDFHAYVMSRVQYKIIATCIECTSGYVCNARGQSVPCYSQLINWCLAPPVRVKVVSALGFDHLKLLFAMGLGLPEVNPEPKVELICWTTWKGRTSCWAHHLQNKNSDSTIYFVTRPFGGGGEGKLRVLG